MWILLALLICQSFAAAPINQKMVIILTGSGARAPLRSLNGTAVELDNYGELTPSGLKQMYLLGRYYRKLYFEDSSLMNKKQNLTEFVIRSVNSRRSLMAAQSFSIGLYPEKTDMLTTEQLNSHDKWLPPFELSVPNHVKDDLMNSAIPYDIPVSPVFAYNQSSERLLSFASCPNFIKNWTAFFKSAQVQKLIDDHSATLKGLCTELEYNFEKLKSDDNLYYFLDFVLASEFHFKITLNETILGEVKGFQHEMFKLFFVQNKFVTLCEFSRVVGEYLNNAKANKLGHPKMVVLTTDEMYVFGYLFAAGILEKEGIAKTIDFGSSAEIILFEKAEKQSEVTVRVNGKDVENFASVEDFYKKIESIKDCWKTLCQS